MVLLELTNIVAGLVLAAGIVPALPAVGPSLGKVARALGGVQVVIGIAALVLGLLNFLGIQGIVAILAGFVLLTGVLPSVPALGKDLHKLAKRLGPFQGAIGVAAILVGILGLLRVL